MEISLDFSMFDKNWADGKDKVICKPHELQRSF